MVRLKKKKKSIDRRKKSKKGFSGIFFVFQLPLFSHFLLFEVQNFRWADTNIAAQGEGGGKKTIGKKRNGDEGNKDGLKRRALLEHTNVEFQWKVRVKKKGKEKKNWTLNYFPNKSPGEIN